MAQQQIRFEDGAAYERMMGVWSRIAGGIFLDWIAPRVGLRWVDIGCGSGDHANIWGHSGGLTSYRKWTSVAGIEPSAVSG